MRQSGGTIVSRRQASWENVQLDLIRRTSLERQETNVLADKHSIFLNIKGAALAGEDSLNGKRIVFQPRGEGSLIYLPPRCHWQGWDEGDRDAAYLRISVNPSFVNRLSDGNALGPLKADIGFYDLEIQSAARRIAREIDRNDAASALLVEGNVIAIFGQMLRRNSQFGLRAPRGGLSPGSLRKTLEFVDASLEKPLRLEEMAAAAGVGVHHFQRAFRQSVGMSPHKYLSSLRLRRASDLLRSTDLTVTDICFQCGFYSPSHFSSRFYSHAGVSPSLYRRLWRQ